MGSETDIPKVKSQIFHLRSLRPWSCCFSVKWGELLQRLNNVSRSFYRVPVSLKTKKMLFIHTILIFLLLKTERELRIGFQLGGAIGYSSVLFPLQIDALPLSFRVSFKLPWCVLHIKMSNLE